MKQFNYSESVSNNGKSYSFAINSLNCTQKYLYSLSVNNKTVLEGQSKDLDQIFNIIRNRLKNMDISR